MSLSCSACGARFTSRDDDPRCPQCLRKSTVREHREAPPVRRPLPWAIPVGVVIMGAASVGSALPSAAPIEPAERVASMVTLGVIGLVGFAVAAFGVVRWLRRK